MASQLRRFTIILLPAALALLSGCIFSPEKKPPKPKPPIQYLAPISPQNVLQNLIKAYVERDSIQTRLVYDEFYEGTSSAPSAPVPFVQFTRAQEVSHVKRLKDDPNIVSVFLDLGAPGTWQRLEGNSSDPPGWAIIPIVSQTIRVEDISLSTTWESSNRVIEYTFKPTVAGIGDTTWTVVRWTEIGN